MLYADGDNIASAVLSALNERDRDVREQVITVASRTADPDMLVRAVADHCDAVRRNAALDALTRGGARSVPALVRALGDPDPEVVMFAATVLGKTRDREAIPHLVRLLDHEDVNIVQAAIESLGHLRATAAVQRLTELLDRDPWLRFGAVHALGEIGDPRAAEPLGAALGDDDVWELAVAALGKVRSPDAIGHLAKALIAHAAAPDFDVALRALGDALRRQPRTEPLQEIPSWAQLAGDADGPVPARLAAILEEASAGAGDPDLIEAAAMVVKALDLRPLYGALVRSARNPALRPVLEFWTLAAGVGVAEALIDGLSDPDPAVRVLACRSGGILRARSMVEPMLARLSDDDPGVRVAAVRALVQLDPDAAVAGLTACLIDAEPAVRQAAQQALGACDAARSSEALLGFPHRDAAVVAALLRVMRAGPHSNQLPFLFDCLRHDEPEVRALAVEALAEQADLDLVSVLVPSLDDPAEAVRATAVRVLGRRRTARAVELLVQRLERAPIDARLLVSTLIEMGGPLIAPRLVEVYRRHPGPALTPILEALVELREPAVEPVLVALLADDDAGRRRFAVASLASFGTPVAIRHVIAAGTDPAPEVRAAVADALGELGEAAAAIAELERLCFDENRMVATTARHHLEARHVD
jgi:HEAT repeat protein